MCIKQAIRNNVFLIGSDGDHLILYDREWRALLANIELPQNEIKRNHPLFFQPFNLTATTPVEDWVDINKEAIERDIKIDQVYE